MLLGYNFNVTGVLKHKIQSSLNIPLYMHTFYLMSTFDVDLNCCSYVSVSENYVSYLRVRICQSM